MGAAKMKARIMPTDPFGGVEINVDVREDNGG